MNFRQQRQNTLCNSTAISVVLLHTSNAEATSMVIRMSNTFQMHFQINYKCRFAIHKLLTDPSLLTINYTVLDGCLLLKANKQWNWLSKILGAGNYTGWSGCETKMCDCSSVVYGVLGMEDRKAAGSLFWMNNVFFLKLQTMCGAGLNEFKQNSNSVRDACICDVIGGVHLKNVSSVIVYSPSCRSKPVWFFSTFATQKELIWIVCNLFFSTE